MCFADDFRYDMQKGLRPRRSVRTAMAHECMMCTRLAPLNALW